LSERPWPRRFSLSGRELLGTKIASHEVHAGGKATSVHIEENHGYEDRKAGALGGVVINGQRFGANQMNYAY